MKILVVGCGNIGSRHLQGLLKYQDHDLFIDVFDPDFSALKLGEKRACEIETSRSHKVDYHSNFVELDSVYDLVVHTTTAQVRMKSISLLSQVVSSKLWILEKIISQSTAQLNAIQKMLDNADVFVNHWMRSTKWAADIKMELASLSDNMVSFEVSGSSWGMLCNTLHWVDLIEFLLDTKIQAIHFSHQKYLTWIDAKRTGFKEALGEYMITFNNGTTLQIKCDNNLPYSENMRIFTQNSETILELNYINASEIQLQGFGKELRFPQDLQSDMSKKFPKVYYDAVNQTGLTPLTEAATTHAVFLDALLVQWNGYTSESQHCVPIT